MSAPVISFEAAICWPFTSSRFSHHIPLTHQPCIASGEPLYPKAGPALCDIQLVIGSTPTRASQPQLLPLQGSGMSVMEMSHRGKEFVGIASEAEADLRQLLDIPSNYKVLFMQARHTSA